MKNETWFKTLTDSNKDWFMTLKDVNLSPGDIYVFDTREDAYCMKTLDTQSRTTYKVVRLVATRTIVETFAGPPTTVKVETFYQYDMEVLEEQYFRS